MLLRSDECGQIWATAHGESLNFGGSGGIRSKVCFKISVNKIMLSLHYNWNCTLIHMVDCSSNVTYGNRFGFSVIFGSLFHHFFSFVTQLAYLGIIPSSLRPCNKTLGLCHSRSGLAWDLSAINTSISYCKPLLWSNQLIDSSRTSTTSPGIEPMTSPDKNITKPIFITVQLVLDAMVFIGRP
jgi:hypothetical protein